MTVGDYLSSLRTPSLNTRSFSQYNINESMRVAMFADYTDSKNYEIPIHLNPCKRLFSGSFVIKTMCIAPIMQKSTASSILACFYRNQYAGILYHVVTSKQETYYGARGIILNANMNALMCVTQKVTEEEGNVIIYRISPDVFHSNGTIEKAIVRFGIPSMTEFDEVFFAEGISSNRHKVRVIIDDNVDKFLHIPNIPVINEDKEVEINKLLLRDISAIS